MRRPSPPSTSCPAIWSAAIRPGRAALHRLHPDGSTHLVLDGATISARGPEPAAGAVFRARPGVTGLPAATFAG
ncbi:hypothetical protein [Pseudonocardia acidicola]|uniref:Uncharacterized protein n=1 Tax=Pseudonocardia acidicola TaxID=2724939 RepID=A0ABX1SIL2_9PSEU|nr:hypothetical protein [Pseudonocardia acidicola]